MSFDQSIFMIFFFPCFTRLNIRQHAIDNITLAYCALAKRGQVTEKFCTKVQNSVTDELRVNITLFQAALNALYKGYMQGVNENNAKQVLSSLNNLIPDITSRLKLTLQQVAGSGLTLYVIIGRAFNKYQNFP